MEGIAELSYLLGDDSVGVSAVFDPTADVDKYVRLAREKKGSRRHESCNNSQSIALL